MQDLQIIEVKGQRVLTTRQIAECYGTGVKIINNNYARNKERYVIGKHFMPVEGDELRDIITHHQIEGELKRAHKAFFWTEKGALLHAKSLNTDKAWEVYDYLVDFYFRAKEEKVETAQGQQATEKKAVIPVNTRTEKVPEAIEAKIELGEKADIFVKLIHLVEKLRGEVYFATFRSKSEGMMISDNLRNLRIGIRSEMDFDRYIYNIAYELAHYFLHFDKGDVITSSRHKEYEEQADRGARMLLSALGIER